jgi:dolichyl-phosphate-mannose-protein mannosyltransferase
MDTIAVTLVSLIGGIIRFVNLSSPTDLIFDETYYAKDACFYLAGAADVCDTDYEITYVHPPLGKWLLAIGIRIFGFDSFGWRIVAVVAGTITILLLYMLARAILHSTLAAVLASGLLAVDLLHFVQSRVSMLDIFVPMFGVAAFLFLVYDRERLLEKLEHPPDPDERKRWRPSVLDRPWRLAAGLAAGAATACKWSGGLILVAVVVLSIAWEVGARRKTSGWGLAIKRTFLEETPSILLWLVIAPIVIYSATYIGRLGGSFFAWPWTDGSWLNNLYDQQITMLDFHQHLDATHSYQSPPWSWLLLKRPVSYYFHTSPNGDYREIMATGSPFVWWSSILALVYTAVAWLRGRDMRDPAGLIFTGFALAYLPWLVFARSAVFIFYLLPAIPFMYLAIAYVSVRIGESWEARTAVSIFAAGSVGLFMFYLPLGTGAALPQDRWDQRIWVFDNCDPPPAVRTTITVTSTRNDRTVERARPTKKPPDSVPPPGWCWI